MAAKKALPAPTGRSQAELEFRRLLASCEDIVDGDTKGRSELADWWHSVVFHHYIEALQEQLCDLESDISSQKLDGEILAIYRQHVSLIANQLGAADQPHYARLLQQQRERADGAAQAASMPKLPALPEHPRSEAPMETVTGLRNRLSKLNGPLEDDVKATLSMHQNMRESITDELRELAAGLKRNAEAMERSVRDRGEVLEEADTLIEDNVVSVKSSAQTAKAVHHRGRVNFCMTCLALVLVATTFVGMYMFIKFTNFAGYRGPPWKA